MEASISQQIVHQMRLELEQLLQLLRDPIRKVWADCGVP
jgi:hypothetical protein